MSDKKLGLVLGSGASRGWAHIGAIEALEAHGLTISMISGASAGSFIGAAYAAGGLASVKKFALDMDWKTVLAFLDLAFPRSGFIEGKRVADLIQEHTHVTHFEELSIPVKMVATDMFTAEQVILSKGNIRDALKATMAVPGVVTPVLVEDRWLVDGGVVNPLPVDVCREMGADVIVAVDLNSERISKDPRKYRESNWEDKSRGFETKRLEVVKSWMLRYGERGKTLSTKIDQWFSKEESSPHIFEVLGSSLNIMQKKIELMNLEAHPPDVLVEPRLGDMKFFDFDDAGRAIQEGYVQTEALIPQIKEKLDE